METLKGPHKVIHQGDDSPVAIGRAKGGQTVAVWVQLPYKKHGGYAMEESVFNEMIRDNPQKLLLVDHKDKTVYEVNLQLVKHPKKFILPDEEAMDRVNDLNAHGGLVQAAADLVVEPSADTDEIQRLVPYEGCDEVGQLEAGKGSFAQVFSDYRK